MNGGWFLGLDPCAEIMRDADGKPAEEYTILRAPFATFLEVWSYFQMKSLKIL